MFETNISENMTSQQSTTMIIKRPSLLKFLTLFPYFFFLQGGRQPILNDDQIRGFSVADFKLSLDDLKRKIEGIMTEDQKKRVNDFRQKNKCKEVLTKKWRCSIKRRYKKLMKQQNNQDGLVSQIESTSQTTINSSAPQTEINLKTNFPSFTPQIKNDFLYPCINNEEEIEEQQEGGALFEANQISNNPSQTTQEEEEEKEEEETLGEVMAVFDDIIQAENSEGVKGLLLQKTEDKIQIQQQNLYNHPIFWSCSINLKQKENSEGIQGLSLKSQNDIQIENEDLYNKQFWYS